MREQDLQQRATVAAKRGSWAPGRGPCPGTAEPWRGRRRPPAACAPSRGRSSRPPPPCAAPPRAGRVGRDHEAPLGEGAPPALQGKAHVVQNRRCRAERVGEALRRCSRAATERADTGSSCQGRADAVAPRQRRSSRMMCAFVPRPEGADPGAPRRARSRPGRGPCPTKNGVRAKSIFWSGPEVDGGRQELAVGAKACLDDPGGAGGRRQVAEVRLDAADTAERVRAVLPAKAWVSPSTSMGSPSGVAVPWASTTRWSPARRRTACALAMTWPGRRRLGALKLISRRRRVGGAPRTMPRCGRRRRGRRRGAAARPSPRRR